MHFLLEKEDKRKLEVFSYLENTPLQTASFQELKEELNLSDFLVGKAVKELISDIEMYQLTKSFSIEENHKEVQLRKFGNDSVSHLLWMYMRNSHNFSLLNAVFTSDTFSLENFANTLFISPSKSYSIKLRIDKYLLNYQLGLDLDYKLTGGEKKIRLFYYNLFFITYKHYEFPFSQDISNYTLQLSEIILTSFPSMHTETSKLKLKFFIAVLFSRLDSGFMIENTDISSNTKETKEYRKLSEDIVFFFEQFTSLTTEEISNEVEFIFNFLLVENYLPLENRLTDLFTLEIKNMTQLFLDKLEARFPLALNDVIQVKMIPELDYVHSRIFYYENVLLDWNYFINNSILKENYTEFYIFCNQFIDNIQLNNLTISLDSFKATLLYDYMFILIKHFPMENLFESVTITIDFSHGQNYNYFIQTNLVGLPYFKFKINYQLSEATDIYLSDITIPNLSCDYLIWNNPPSATDWEIFGNLVMHVQNKKRERRIT